MAEATNKFLEKLLHGDNRWMETRQIPKPKEIPVASVDIADDSEETLLSELNTWLLSHSLSAGEVSFEYVNQETGAQEAIFDLAWPSGLQEGLTEPIAVLLNENTDVLILANKAGFRCFTDIGSFKGYVKREIIRED